MTVTPKTILCFGDSNTWGFNPGDGGRRFPPDVRWTGVLSRQLGPDFRVVEEGCNARTTVFDDFLAGGGKNGLAALPVCLVSHKPLDLVILMLGTNDLKGRFSLSAEDISLGVEQLVKLVQRSPDCGPDYASLPQLLLVSPIHVSQNIAGTVFSRKFAGLSSRERSLELAHWYSLVAQRHGCHFLDASLYGHPSLLDGIHMEAESHHALGLAIADKVQEIFQGGVSHG